MRKERRLNLAHLAGVPSTQIVHRPADRIPDDATATCLYSLIFYLLNTRTLQLSKVGKSGVDLANGGRLTGVWSQMTIQCA